MTANWISDDVVNQLIRLHFLYHLMVRKSMVRLNFDAHDTLESMALCINSFDIRGNDTWFFAVIYVHERRSCSNRNYNLMRVPDESLDNVESDSPMKFLAINAACILCTGKSRENLLLNVLTKKLPM